MNKKIFTKVVQPFETYRLIFCLSLVFATAFLYSEQKDEEWIEGTTSIETVIIKETTREIMLHPAIEHPNLEGMVRGNEIQWARIQNPLSPPLEISESDFLDSPLISRAIPPLSFLAATLEDINAFPPDSMGAVGPTQFIAACNNLIRSFDKCTGAPDNVLNVSTDDFFAQVLGPNARTSDPQIRYDHIVNRWFIVIISVTQPGTPNQIFLAVSNEGTITGNTVWSFYSFTPDTLAPTRAIVEFADFPTLGIDPQALYIGVNVFDSSTRAYVNSDAFVISKSALINSGLLYVTVFRNLVDPSTFVGPITPQGVDNFDIKSTEGYFIGVDASRFGRLVLRRVLTPPSGPIMSGNIFINVPQTNRPLLVPHRGNTNGTGGRLDGNDDRLSGSHIRDRRLYTSHGIGVNNQGASSATSSNLTRNGCRWYEIDLTNSLTPQLLQSGTLFSASANNTTDQRFFWIPSIMTNGLHNLVLGCSTAGQNSYADAAYTARYYNDPVNTVRAPVIYTASQTAYNPPGDPGGSGGRRWGDYSNVSLDPDDNMTLWTIQEYCYATNSYGCRVIRIPSPPPPQTIAVTPSIVGQSNNILLTITGTDLTNGKAFYDGGPNFLKRLAVEIQDVKIVSIAYVSPSQINVTINTQGSPVGYKTINITNPDGQSVFTKGRFRVTQ